MVSTIFSTSEEICSYILINTFDKFRRKGVILVNTNHQFRANVFQLGGPVDQQRRRALRNEATRRRIN